MPIYEYKCKKCHAQFDVLQRLGEDGSKLSCPNCGEPRPEKLLSVFASSGSEASGASCSPGSGFT